MHESYIEIQIMKNYEEKFVECQLY